MKQLFTAVRADPIYTSTPKKRPTLAELSAQVPEEEDPSMDDDEMDDEPRALQPMAQPPGPGKRIRQSARSKQMS